MKTFIWHSEYEYVACMADTIANAEKEAKEKYPDFFGGDVELGAVIELNNCLLVQHSNQ